MTDSSTEAAWLQTTLSELLSAPHISIRGPPGIRLGPGPIDLFSTKFNNAFTPDVKAVVAGEEVDRGGLKEKLLALQRNYSPDTVRFRAPEPISEGDSTTSKLGEVRVSFTGVSPTTGEYEISADATVVDTEGGGRKVSTIELDGKPELFKKPSA